MSIPLNYKWVTHCLPLVWWELFSQSDDIPRILEDRDNLWKQEEMLNALQGMQNDKSTYIYALAAEFYKFFWQNTKKYLFNSYMTSFDKIFYVYPNAGR